VKIHDHQAAGGSGAMYQRKEINSMRKTTVVLVVGLLAVMMTQGAPIQAAEPQYEVLTPWADADPVPLRGISPRLDNLQGKKIGLFANFKRAARPMVLSVERRLRTMYPGTEFTIFHSRLPNVTETETRNREQFIDWINSVDAVVAAVGD
jgi:hypothetical protein